MHSNVYAIGHIDLGQSASATLSYVVALGEALSCSSNASHYTIRNSIVNNITCTGQATVERSLVAPGQESLGTGNVAVSNDEHSQIFVDHPAGNFHIRQGPPAYLLGVASRSATDLAVDFDGDTRPAVGRPDYPGIDDAPPKAWPCNAGGEAAWLTRFQHDASIRCMMRRTTLAAEADDLETLQAEARRRRISLARLLAEIVAERAKKLRMKHRPRFGLGRSGRGVARQSVADESSPAASRYKG